LLGKAVWDQVSDISDVIWQVGMKGRKKTFLHSDEISIDVIC
jgi:hypothetical protein